MKKIPVPSWAPPYSRHVVQMDEGIGAVQKEQISRLLPAIYKELDARINDFSNDPGQCFESDSDFPVRERLSGEYYIASEKYQKREGGQIFLIIVVSCLEKEWHVSQKESGTDYLGLEAFVTIDSEGREFIFDDGFNTSSI